MRDSRAAYTFDGRGFFFACKSVTLVIAAFGIVGYGTTRASNYLIAEGSQASALHATLAAATLQSEPHPFTAALLEYEQSLSSRTTGGAAFDALVQARARMVGVHNNVMSLIDDNHVVAHIPFSATIPIPSGLAFVHPITEEGDVFPEVRFPGCIVSGPQPAHDSDACITLDAEAMRQLVDFVGTGVPLFAIAEHREGGHAPTRPLPPISARAFIVADVTDGTVYASKDADTARPIASISKLMTALIARETIREDRTMTVTHDDQSQTEGVPGSIRAGESFTVDELLYPLLMESNNSAAYTLARYDGMEQFTERVRQKISALRMHETVLDDPSGLSPNNVASPRDLVTLLRHIRTYHSLLFHITDARTKTLRAENGRTYSFSNFNHFAGDEGFVGGKTGFIAEAGQTYAGVFDVAGTNGTSTIAIVVLGSEDRKRDSAALLSWYRGN